MISKKKIKNSKGKDLTREAYNDIRKMIFSNELKPGQKIPYRRMAEGLNMSLTPVVQALKHMEFMGLVRHEQNKGFFVDKVTPQEIDEAYKLRSIIEPKMLAQTILNLDEQGEKKIRIALDEYIEACQKGSLKLKLVKDIQFHMSIAELSGQNLSILILKYLFDFLYLRFGQELIFSRPSEDSTDAHTAIFNAIKSKDIETAAKVLEKHIKDIHKNALDGIQERLSEADDIIF
ncbi:MAG: GntR family transcriptional regulator [Desulfobacula sp.]|uniref:GntR family transcriptional regulator n=1 Tax=Desulfobacula sp. TaxID=2593537 RepID=UPI0025C5AA12|nr:GntR family transcriptional regulator [Desulfobacula sp.]MCD4720759.1 GntR family transcriptional regulator [Desulfobacula sp.]